MAFIDIAEYQLHKLCHKKRPLAVVVAVTNRCSLRCQMCNIWQNKASDITTGQWHEILKDDFYSLVKTLIVTGGEPMLHKNFVELCVMMIHTLGVRRFTINTSGIYPDKVKSLMEKTSPCPDRTVIISVDGGRETHNRIRGVPAAFDKAMESAEIVRQASVRLSFQMTITDQEISDIEALREIASRYGAIANFKLAYTQEMLKNTSMSFSIKNDVRSYLLAMFKDGAKNKPWRDKTSFQDFTEIDQLLGNNRNAPCSFMDGTAVYLSGAGKVYVCQNEREDTIGDLDARIAALKKQSCSSCRNTCLNTAALRSHWMVYLKHLMT